MWQVGRVSHVDLQENGAGPMAPPALAASAGYCSIGAVNPMAPVLISRCR